jgi:hypothetical protein
VPGNISGRLILGKQAGSAISYIGPNLANLEQKFYVWQKRYIPVPCVSFLPHLRAKTLPPNCSEIHRFRNCLIIYLEYLILAAPAPVRGTGAGRAQDNDPATFLIQAEFA